MKLSIPIAVLLFMASFVSTAQTPAKKSKPTPVIVALVERVEFFDEVEALGTLKANESVDLASSVTELVTDILFTDNQRVKKGDVLIKMDAAEELAELSEQRSFMREAQRQVTRLTPLAKKGAASEAILDENKRNLSAAKARINAVQSRIDQRIVKAPFDGIVGLRNISVGALARPGSLITTIDDDLTMKLDFAVPEVFLSTLKIGLDINATTDAYPQSQFKGEIKSVNSRIDPTTRSIQTRALIDNSAGLLKPGLLMQVVLKKSPRNTLIVPEESIIADGPNNFILVVKQVENILTSSRQRVKVGARKFGIAEILEGLSEGDQVITHGTIRVRPGMPLEIKAIERNNESLNELLNQNSVSAPNKQKGN